SRARRSSRNWGEKRMRIGAFATDHQYRVAASFSQIGTDFPRSPQAVLRYFRQNPLKSQALKAQ
ncbi:MAG: hypothetical protein NTZ72_01640, partial [Afipia sp.]|nr:hypothetical protein [Afipia sp.]